MKTFICDELDINDNSIPASGCGRLEYILFDGCEVAESDSPYFDILEGVKFKAFLNNKQEVEVDTFDDWDADDYFAGLNRNYWLKLALEFVKNPEHEAECPKCGSDSIGTALVIR